ncbi:MAG: ABC transporter permease, partial [Bacteroidetes bacterium]
MRNIRLFVYKEFRQLFRNRSMLPIVVLMPMFQLLVLAYAADFEIKDVRLFVMDLDQSSFSRRLRGKFEGTTQFVTKGYSFSGRQASIALEEDDADIVLSIPSGFERDLVREGSSRLHITANAIDGVRGSLASAYAAQVIQDFNQELITEYGPRIAIHVQQPAQTSRVDITWSHWFNPRMDYKTFMVPGILALLVSMIGMFLSGMNIVREKEIGTIEQLNVTPIRKYQFVIGKLLPYWLLALFDLAVGLILGRIFYSIPFLGSIPLLFLFSGIYLLVVLGIGLFISASTDTQQQALFISWFFMVIFIFLSGMFTAVENMPDWAQRLTYFNPMRY